MKHKAILRRIRLQQTRAGVSVLGCLILVSAVAIGFSSPSQASIAQSVTFTTDCCIVSSADGLTFTVPDGITTLQVQVTGAGGGGSYWGAGVAASPGGNGAIVNATLSVTPGEVLSLELGEGGRTSEIPDTGQMVSGSGGGGFATGGAGGVNSTSALGAGGGGGATAILSGTTPLVVAGGGGGASGALPLTLGSPINSIGGNCSYPTMGTNGFEYCTPSTTSPNPTVSTTSACPGLDAVGPNANPTSTCPVATGAHDTHDGSDGSDAAATNAYSFPPGGGGGGGWIGGSGGTDSSVPFVSGGGQGGSSYTNAARTSEVSVTSAANAGATGIARFCSVGNHIVSAGDTTTVPPTTICPSHPTQAGDGTIIITFGGGDTAVHNATGSSSLPQDAVADPPRAAAEPMVSVAAIESERPTTARAAIPVAAKPTYTG